MLSALQGLRLGGDVGAWGLGSRRLGFGIRRPSGVLDESEVKPPFFPPFTPPKKRAPESPQGGGGPRILFFMEDAEPARSGVDAAGGEFRRL